MPLFAVVAASGPARPAAHGPAEQPGALVVTVLDSASRHPLRNAEVIDRATDQRRFTDERGTARLAWGAGGRLTIRVRQLGFRYVDRTLQRATHPAHDTVTVVLARVAYVLPPVATAATTHCVADADSASKLLSAAVLEQLRLGADRYESFRRAYPFRVRLTRRTVRVGRDGKPGPVRERAEETDSERWGERYRPGRVVERSGLGFSVPVLFLSALADPAFWSRHCFVARGVESFGGTRVVRMEFSPRPGLRGPDWAGAALVDSATSILRRVEFRLAGLGTRDWPRRLEGHTSFASPAPLVVVPDTTIAMWWYDGPGEDGEWGPPSVGQLIHVAAMEYRKARPAAPASATDSAPR